MGAVRALLRHTGLRLGAVLVLLAASPSTPAQQQAAVDPRVVGTWSLQTINPQGAALRYLWEIRPDGGYGFRSEGTGGPAAHSGRAAFVDGRWSLEAATGQAGWTDSGIYQVLSPDMVFFAGRLGPGTWQRAGGTPPAAAAPWPRTLPEMARRAVTTARTQRPDAILYEIEATRRPPTLAPRPPEDAYEIGFRLYSPSEQFILSVTPGNAAGEVWPGGRYDLTGREAIPDRFLDLAEAERRAQLLGMRGRAERAALSFDRSYPWPRWIIWPVSASRTWNINGSVGGMPAPLLPPEQIRDRLRETSSYLPTLARGLGEPGRLTASPPPAPGLVEQILLRLEGVGKKSILAVAVHGDRVAATRSLEDLTEHGGQYAQRSRRQWADAGIGTVELRCLLAFSPGRHLAARCAWMHPTLPLVASGEVEVQAPDRLETAQIEELVDRAAFPLTMAAVFYIADVLPR
ncbi:MAG: hypothetical protein IT561_00540 [Alphaproteobacteria bacterium]|nr:hypothetical protein [Alphaproteobacteria bacterium]